jgi:DNA polymerase I-like protein with 3'-5' exonuclease and polymerase domains
VEQQALLDTYDFQAEQLVKLRGGRELRLVCSLVQDEAALAEMVGVLEGVGDVSYDSETTGLRPALGARIVGHALSVLTPSGVAAWYVPVRHMGPDSAREPQVDPAVAADAVREVLAGPGRCVPLAVAHDENRKSYRLKDLATEHVCQGAARSESAVNSWLQKDAQSLGLVLKRKDSAYADGTLPPPTYLERFGFGRVPIRLAATYACRDAFYALYLALSTFRDVAARWPEVVRREHAVARRLMEVERAGLPIDSAGVRADHERLSKHAATLLAKLRELSGVADFSATDNEVRAVLYSKWKLKALRRTEADLPSVDKVARKLLAEKYPERAEFLTALDDYAELVTVLRTFSASILRYASPETGRVYPSYNQIEKERSSSSGVPKTGRLSSSEPNAQNIKTKPIELPDGPVTLREHFVVDEGYVHAYCDWNQVELRMLTWFSRDPALLDVYATGKDIHGEVSKRLKIERRPAKEYSFGIIYGATEYAISERLPGYYEGPEGTRERAKREIARYHEEFPGILRFRREFANRAVHNDCSFVNPFGRPRRIPALAADEDWRRDAAQRRMMSSIISGTCADLMKESLLRCCAILDEFEGSSVVQLIHDEFVFRLPMRDGWVRILRRCVDAMEDWPQFAPVPIKASVELSMTSWKDKEEIEFVGEDSFRWVKCA